MKHVNSIKKTELHRKGKTHPKETDYLPQIPLLESLYLFNRKVNFDITDYEFLPDQYLKVYGIRIKDIEVIKGILLITSC